MREHVQSPKRFLNALLTIVSGAVVSSFFLFSTASAAPTLQTVYRLYNPYTGLHLQTIDSNEDSALTTAVILDGKPYVWKNETPTFDAYAATSNTCPTGTEQVYRVYNHRNGDHLLTADSNEAAILTQSPTLKNDWSSEGIGFCAYATQVAGTIPVYRLYNTANGEHFLTADQTEAYGLNGVHNWHIETADNGGVAFYANPY